MPKLGSKYLLFIAVTFITLQVSAKQGDTGCANWLYSIDAAKKMAIEKNENILISFSGSDWCVPCMRLEKNLFSDYKFIEYANQHLVLLKLDFPAKKANKLSDEQLMHNEALAEKYNKKGSFPLVVIIDKNGIVKGYMTHPSATLEAYIHSIDNIINQPLPPE